MPSYTIRQKITLQTSNKILGKRIKIIVSLKDDNEYIDRIIGPIISIYPIKNRGLKNQVLIFYLDQLRMRWILYEYKQIEIPKNINKDCYILKTSDEAIAEDSVPIKINLPK